MRLQYHLTIAICVMLLSSLLMRTLAQIETVHETSSNCQTADLSNNEHVIASPMIAPVVQSTEHAQTPAKSDVEPLDGSDNQDLDMQQVVDTHKYDNLIGKTIVDEASQQPDGAETVTRAYLESLNQESGDDRMHAVRIIGPGMGYTRDYRPNRVNFFYDEHNRIFKIEWF